MHPSPPIRLATTSAAGPLDAARFSLQATDVALLAASAWLAYWLHFGTLDMPTDYQRITLLNALLGGLLLPWIGVYRDWRGQGRFAEYRALLTGLGGVFVAYAAVALLLKLSADFSRLWTAQAYALAAVGMIGLRECRRRLLRQYAGKRRAIVIGHGELAERVLRHLRADATSGVEIVGCFGSGADSGDIPHLGDVDAAAAFVTIQPVHQVWLALPLSADQDIASVLHGLRHSAADVRLVPDAFSAMLLSAPQLEMSGLSALNLRSCPLDGLGQAIKTAEDYVLASLLLLGLSPLLLALAVGVKLSSPGPVLFRQQRHGRDGQTIEVWKFRTMCVHSEEPGHVTQACRNDPRVTRFGAFLRRTSLDELPQLINVLQGRMSLVGPRPHAIEHDHYYGAHIHNYLHRHRAKPGITGWAQVNGLRGETDTVEKMAARVQHDVHYIQNWSPLLDLRILVRTLRATVHSNAY